MAKNSDLISVLEQIGLNEKEAVVYLTLLSLGTVTAYEIAQHCDVKKPTVYVILEDLRKKGLVLKVPHSKKALFSGKDIDEYLSEQERRVKSVRAIAPQLQKLGSQTSPKVFFFTGVRGIAEALDYRLSAMRGKTYYSFYENLEGAAKEVVDLFAKWDKKALAAGASFKIIMGRKYAHAYYKDLMALSRDNDAIQVKVLKEHDYPANVSFEVGDGFVRILNEKDLYATIIDDRAAAEAMRHIFEMVWEKGT